MKRRSFLLTCHDAGGTVPPMLALAESLLQGGHDVLMLSQPSVRRRAEAAGCAFAAFTNIVDYAPRTALEDQIELVVPALTAKTVGDDIVALGKLHAVDLVVVDANLGGALAAAESLSQPSAVLLHSMYKTFVDIWFADLWPFLEPAINDTRTGYELPPAHDWPSVFAGHDRVLAVVPSVFDAPVADVPKSMRHFGFLVPRGLSKRPTPGFPRGDDPTVLVGLSTTYAQQESLLQTILEALASLAVRALVTTAGQVDIDALPHSSNVTITDVVPHTQVLDQTDVMVTHAGLGTVAAALTFGVPLVCTPGGRDQPLNAQRVAELGAGIALTERPTAAEVAGGIELLLSDAGYRDAARSLAKASGEEGGAAAAAAELVSLLG